MRQISNKLTCCRLLRVGGEELGEDMGNLIFQSKRLLPSLTLLQQFSLSYQQ